MAKGTGSVGMKVEADVRPSGGERWGGPRPCRRQPVDRIARSR